MESHVTFQVSPGETVDLVLKGPSKTIEGLLQRLRSMHGPLVVTGGKCCWSLSREGVTFHLVVDSD